MERGHWVHHEDYEVDDVQGIILRMQEQENINIWNTNQRPEASIIRSYKLSDKSKGNPQDTIVNKK